MTIISEGSKYLPFGLWTEISFYFLFVIHLVIIASIQGPPSQRMHSLIILFGFLSITQNERKTKKKNEEEIKLNI